MRVEQDRGGKPPFSDRAQSVAHRAYRRLLSFYPAEFRRRFGGEMAQVFLDRGREELRRGGISGLASLWIHTLADLAVTVPAEQLDTLLQDLRYGIRTLANSPGFTAAALLSLALGIGINTAIFSVVNAVLVRPLPYREPDRLVDVSEVPPKGGSFAVAPATFLDWRRQSKVFEDMAAISNPTVAWTGVQEPVRIRASRVSASFFPLLGIRPALGRTFLAEEDAGGRGVAVLSHELWQRQFGGDAGILGRTLTLDDEAYAVVGVMPLGFRVILRPWDPVAAEMWLPDPFHSDPPTQRVIHRLGAIARLKPGVSLEQAQAEMDRIARGLAQAHPDSNKDWGVALTPLQDHLVKSVRTPLLMLMGAVVCVLLIACGNIANLLLTRASQRQREIGVRNALGAGRLRLARQLLTESLLLALAGGAAGLLLARWGNRALIALAPGSIPRLDEAALDSRVLAFTLIVAVLTGLLFGLAPALQGSRPSLNEWLKEGGGSGSAGPRRQRFRSALVAVEVAMALVLLAGAGLMVKSFLRYQAVARGFDLENVLTTRVSMPRARYAEQTGTGGGEKIAGWAPTPMKLAEGIRLWSVRPEQTAFVEGVVERVAALPEVQAAGAIDYLPAGRISRGLGFGIEGRSDPDQRPVAWYRAVTPGCLRAMGIPLLRGRHFTEADTEQSPRVVIISEAVARRFWPDADPLGERLRMRDGVADTERLFEIVGVAGNTKQNLQNVLSLGSWGRLDQVLYFPYRQQAQAYVDYNIHSRLSVNFVVRTRSDPKAVAPVLRAALKELDPDQPIESITTLKQLVSDADRDHRFYLLLLGVFAALAAGLAAVGVYGVMSYAVAQRRHEIGVRMALGAGAGDVVKLVLRQGLAVTLIGVALGLLAAMGLTRFVASLLYGVSPTDPGTLALVACGLIAVSLLACYVPARRATKLDPITAIRCE